MRASTAWFGRRHAGADVRADGSVWGDPHGAIGMAALTAMALKNGGQNRAALDVLNITAGQSLLEIGCGPGMGVRAALKRVGASGFVAGVDHSGCAIHTASHVNHLAVLRGQAALIRAHAADLPFRDAMFERAFAVNSFQFWPDPARALREITRVLSPKGRLAITQRAAHADRRTDFAGAPSGFGRVEQAAKLFKAQGWRMIDERIDADGSRLLAVSIVAERPA